MQVSIKEEEEEEEEGNEHACKMKKVDHATQPRRRKRVPESQCLTS